MKNTLLFLFAFLYYYLCVAQTIPSERMVDWSVAGFKGTIPDFSRIKNISEYGGIGDGITINDIAFQNALNGLGGMSGVIYFPAGTYLFNSGFILPDSVILRGESSSSSILKFNLSGGASNLLEIMGSESSLQTSITDEIVKGSFSVNVSDASGFQIGDYVKIYQDPGLLMFSDWAAKSLGQIVRIVSISGNEITFENAIRKKYSVEVNPRMIKLLPKKYVGLECFTIQRIDETTDQYSNIDFNIASHCWVTGVESNTTNFAHVNIVSSTNILVRGCYLHHAFSYGEGGKAYGVILQMTSGECLIENNIFNHLRHSMVLQAGSNGNVLSYNYSINPYWDQSPYPTNTSGDIVLHGNYPYSNLIEGNIVQNIVVDDSHGKNGPYNTFFRNLAELYGLYMNNNPATDSLTFVGNDFPNTGFLMGNFLLSGVDHFVYGNRVRGVLDPVNTDDLPDQSYYLSSAPGFFSDNYPWPTIGTPFLSTAAANTAKDRDLVGNYTDCRTNTLAGVDQLQEEIEWSIYPNPTSGKLYLNLGTTFKEMIVNVFYYNGKLAASSTIGTGESINLDFLPEGIFFLKIGGRTFKFVKIN